MARHLTVEDVALIAIPKQPALSPDGSQIAYVLRTVDSCTDRNVYEIWTVATMAGAARRLTMGGSDSSPAWSPDGQTIAFLRGASGPAQLCLLTVVDGAVRELTNLPLGAGAPAWSPDGASIAFSAEVDAAAEPGEDEATRDRRAVAPIVADRLDYVVDGRDFVRAVRRQVHVVDVASGIRRQLTFGEQDASAPTWSPDGSQLAFVTAWGPGADLTGCSAALVIGVGPSPSAPRAVGAVTGIVNSVSWTADASALLVVGRLRLKDTKTALFRVPLSGDAIEELGSALDRSVMPGDVGYPGGRPQPGIDNSVLFCVSDRGSTRLYVVDVDGGMPIPIISNIDCTISGLSVAAGRATFVLNTAHSVGEIAVVDLASGERRVRTSHGENLGDAAFYPREERTFTISDGGTVQGWIMRPPDAGSPTPLLLDVHGGPHNSWHPTADDTHLYHQQLVALGWTVLLLNPRGSDGYGVEFLRAVQGAWGIADLMDLLEPVDTLVAEGLVDPKRLGITGFSYGGYMTCYLTSRDTRFAAAVAGGVVSDLTSQAGTSDNRREFVEWELPGRPWVEPEKYAAMSPLSAVENVRTPTLILQGEVDRRCPLGQAQQWHTALRAQGVPTRLVIYPGSTHTMNIDGRPSHRVDYGRRLVDWLRSHIR